MAVLWFHVFVRWLRKGSTSNSESYSSLQGVAKGKKTTMFKSSEAEKGGKPLLISSYVLRFTFRAEPWKFSADFHNLRVRRTDVVLYNNKINQHEQ